MSDRRAATNRSHREALHHKYADRLVINPALNRILVSYQGNKGAPFFRWLRFKEGFSSSFVEYMLRTYKPPAGENPTVLDPFAGSGTTLSTATRNGWNATGIELLPVGIAAMKARLIADRVDLDKFQRYLAELGHYRLDETTATDYRFPHIRITEKAFDPGTEVALSAYHGFLNRIDDPQTRFLFWFACLSVLEEVSYTRKDGQYLRWDVRAGKARHSTFNKGPVSNVQDALCRKLTSMLEDLRHRSGGSHSPRVRIVEGSTLEEMPGIPDNTFHLVVTSPPYCNRYDYTRTYALELAFLGHGEDEVKDLRQCLLSATVENRSKLDWLSATYQALGRGRFFADITAAFEKQEALHEVLGILHQARSRHELNNSSIPDMVQNYFFEMNVVIWELARVLKAGGHVVMVNDNVRYHGEEIPVDLILSDFAERAGLNLDQIWVLPQGKGNSSQQMGAHGRAELRKCVYVWSKPAGRSGGQG